MAKKFDPAAHDKHAADPREAAAADQETHAKLEAGLIGGSFPASDPVSAAQPVKGGPRPKAPKKNQQFNRAARMMAASIMRRRFVS